MSQSQSVRLFLLNNWDRLFSDVFQIKSNRQRCFTMVVNNRSSDAIIPMHRSSLLGTWWLRNLRRAHHWQSSRTRHHLRWEWIPWYCKEKLFPAGILKFKWLIWHLKGVMKTYYSKRVFCSHWGDWINPQILCSPGPGVRQDTWATRIRTGRITGPGEFGLCNKSPMWNIVDSSHFRCYRHLCERRLVYSLAASRCLSCENHIKPAPLSLKS